jgi:hypothetical protein
MYPYSATSAQLHLVNKDQPKTGSHLSKLSERVVAVDLFTTFRFLRGLSINFVCLLKARYCLGIRAVSAESSLFYHSLLYTIEPIAEPSKPEYPHLLQFN